MAKRHTNQAKRDSKRIKLIKRTACIWQVSDAQAERLLNNRLAQIVRVNVLKIQKDKALELMIGLGWRGAELPWCDNAYIILEGYQELRDSDLHTEGYIYIQNEASLVPVVALNPQPGEIILDMCAAPGGKTSHIAALTQNKARLTANDNSKTRLMKLANNLARLGVAAELTLFDATRMATKTSALQYDRILLDAPCSGEGLINLSTPASLDTWSIAHIRRLATLQKRLIREAWRLLRPGGCLVYSTCTMAPEENELIIDWLLKRNSDAIIQHVHLPGLNASKAITLWNGRSLVVDVSHALRLRPENGREAFFVCVLRKIEQ